MKNSCALDNLGFPGPANNSNTSHENEDHVIHISDCQRWKSLVSAMLEHRERGKVMLTHCWQNDHVFQRAHGSLNAEQS